MLTQNARDADLFKDLQSTSLIYLGQVYNDGYTAILDKQLIHVVKGTHKHLLENRNQVDGLQHIPLTTLSLPPQTIQSLQLKN